jgi:hypothetical protein
MLRTGYRQRVLAFRLLASLREFQRLTARRFLEPPCCEEILRTDQYPARCYVDHIRRQQAGFKYLLPQLLRDLLRGDTLAHHERIVSIATPADRFGNRADRMAHSLGQTNLFSFVIRQMRIASHGNTP